MAMRCICGCGQRSANRHHVIYAQEIKARKPIGHGRTGYGIDYATRAARSAEQARWLRDTRNLVPIAFGCHQGHHSGHRRLPLSCLPDSVFEFAAELMGPAAYDYLHRHYGGHDPRADMLLSAIARRSVA